MCGGVQVPQHVRYATQKRWSLGPGRRSDEGHAAEEPRPCRPINYENAPGLIIPPHAAFVKCETRFKLGCGPSCGRSNRDGESKGENVTGPDLPANAVMGQTLFDHTIRIAPRTKHLTHEIGHRQRLQQL